MNLKSNVIKIVDETLAKYNDETGLVKSFYKPNYHSNLKPGELHFITESTRLASAIFSCKYEEYYSLANTMLKKVCSLQCKEGETAGLWPYYLEESLEEMVAPDWNFADFNAVPLLYVLKEHSDKLDDGVFEIVADACKLACGAIIRRNLTIIYTNPTVMGIYCTVVCGEIFGTDELIEYGRKKLDKFHYRIMNMGTYDEYNCPGYSMLIANMYSLMLRHIMDSDMHKKITDLNNVVWNMLGEHYHYDMDEFTGPNLRQYVNFGEGGNVFKIAFEDEFDLDVECELLTLVYDTKCPDRIKELALERNKSTEYKRVISNGYIYPYLAPTMTDTQFIRPKYTLGSFSMMDFWNQRRNVVSYIGDKDKKVCIRLRAYHDDYDFASAFNTTAQQKGAAITLINFHTNRGDTHVDLDPVMNATIKARDLRVKYQIQANVDGIIDEIEYHAIENGCKLDIMGVPVEITYPFMEMTGEKPYVQIGRINDTEMFVDLVFYSGEEKEINLKNLESLCAVATITVGENEVDVPVVEKDEEVLTAKWQANGAELLVKGPYKPLKQAHSVLLNEVLIDGKNIVKVAEDECH